MPTTDLTPEQFPEHFRRMLWGLMRLEANALTKADPLVASTAAKVAEIVGDDWRQLVTAKDYQTIGSMLRGRANLYGPGSGVAVVRGLYDTVRAVLDWGHATIASDNDFRLAVATARMEFWERLAELSALPAESWRYLVTGVGAAAGAVTGPLLEQVKAFLAKAWPWLAAAGGALIIIKTLPKKGSADWRGNR
jgi:hypothetical protein